MSIFPKACPEHNETCPYTDRQHLGWQRMTFTDIQCSKPSNVEFAKLILDLQQYHPEAFAAIYHQFKCNNTMHIEGGPTIKYQHQLSYDVWETMVVNGAKEVIEDG